MILESLFNLVNALHVMVAGGGLPINPVPWLYGMLAATYGAAAQAASNNDHCALTRCYVTSAITHALIGAAHHLHM